MRAFLRISLAALLVSGLAFVGCGDERPADSNTQDTVSTTDGTDTTDTTLPLDVTLVTPDQTTTPPQDNTIPPPPVNTQAACQDFAVCTTNCTTPECQNNCMAINPNGWTSHSSWDTCIKNACGPQPPSNDPGIATWAACQSEAERVGGACSLEYQACYTGSGNCIGIFSCVQGQGCSKTDVLCILKCIWAASYTAQEKFNQFTDCALDSCPDPCSTSVGSQATCTDLSTCQPFEACDPTTGTCLFTETSCSTCAQQSCPTQLSACQQDTGIGFFRAPNFSQPEMNPEYKDLPPLEFPLSVVPLLKLHNPF